MQETVVVLAVQGVQQPVGMEQAVVVLVATQVLEVLEAL
jgi:hypothetical protein